MSCIENMLPTNIDDEMEEGEIVDDLSDISSEEEFLLRQRLQVLENYNNVLERKKAKNSINELGYEKVKHALPYDLSEISDTEDTSPLTSKSHNKKLDDTTKTNYKHRKKKMVSIINIDKSSEKKKVHRNKKKAPIKVVSESSEESEDEYRNQRRKLANAVAVTKPKNDSSLKTRLEKMLCRNQNTALKIQINDIKLNDAENLVLVATENCSDKTEPEAHITFRTETVDLINISKEENTNICNPSQVDCVDSHSVKNDKEDVNIINLDDSDEDLELLRQHALMTKPKKQKVENVDFDFKTLVPGEDEDSDTAELRLICLKSALLKKAIEMKQKQKLRKRSSRAFHNDFILDNELNKSSELENNTDIESVDMDIGSDGDDKLKDLSKTRSNEDVKTDTILQNDLDPLAVIPISRNDDIDEDEDLLRAKLLTSLSKNLPNLINPDIIHSITQESRVEKPSSEAKNNKTTLIPEQKPFIIKIGESDSEGEHEATKNLTKMHMRLSEQLDFQQKLDLFLKSTRLEVEKEKLPDKVENPTEQPKQPSKYKAKVVKHLPKSEQIEYKNLVKRMAELEKIKQARQSSITGNKALQPKDTLKPRNTPLNMAQTNIESNLEEQIALSRKKIAEESSKILKLKEEGTKLSQKYKIVATELRNISTAVTLNKKQQRTLQNKLTKIRLEHQALLKRSLSLKHSPSNLTTVNRIIPKNISQKENNPRKDEFKNNNLLKTVKVSVVNDLREDPMANSRLSVQVDVSSNKKTIKLPKRTSAERVVDMVFDNQRDNALDINSRLSVNDVTSNTEEQKLINNEDNKINNDYISPLEALQTEAWPEDPNSFLCPFEVGGTCRDSDCKYLHPKVPTNQ